jgi:hypothetical protein
MRRILTNSAVTYCNMYTYVFVLYPSRVQLIDHTVFIPTYCTLNHKHLFCDAHAIYFDPCKLSSGRSFANYYYYYYYYYYETAIGLTPGGNSTIHIYTQTVQRCAFRRLKYSVIDYSIAERYKM